MILSRFRLFFVYLILFFFGVAPLAGSVDFDDGIRIQKKLAEIPSLSDSEIDLLETLLLISKHWNPSLQIKPLRLEIDNLAQEVKKSIQGSSGAEETVRALRSTIHKKSGYRYTEQVDERGFPTDDEELFLHGMLKSKRGYCMNLSLLYLILAQKLDLPLFGVPLPNHFFVRYEAGKNRINIEATELGEAFPDSFYQQRYLLSSANEGSYFLQNLNTKQTLGAYFSNVGMVYYQNQKIERALFYLKLSTDINPKSIDAQNNLANIYSELHKHPEAIQHYNLALKADPGNSSTLFNLGLALEETGNINEAIETFLQVVQIDNGFAPAHQRLANLYLNSNRITSSLLHLKILSKLQPDSIQNKINIAKAFGRLGQHRLAIQTLKDVQKQSPDNPKIHEELAEAFYRMEDFPRALEQYRYLIDQDQSDLKNFIQLGWTYYRIDDMAMASAWTLRGLNKNQGSGNLNTLAMMNLGFYSLLQKQYRNAKDWYRKVFATAPPEIAEDMIGDIQSVPSKYSQRTDLKFFSGWIYSESQQVEKAKKYLESYLNLETNGEFSEEARSLLRRYGNKNTDRFTRTSQPDSSIPPDMVLVPSGFFKMGSNNTLDDEAPEHRVFLDSFYIDKYEMSAKNFAEFLNVRNNVNGYYLDNKFGTLSYNGRFNPRPGQENLPINNITWQAANDFCKWKNKRLPTEAEWEKAARGENSGMYPWGNQPPSTDRSRFHQTWTEEIKHNVMVPVDSLEEGKSPYGLYNMAGNVKEWVDDWYDRGYYKETDEYANPKGPIGGEFKVVRGGSWRDLKGFIYSSFRNNGNPKSRMDDYGFRCARNADPDSGPKKLTSRRAPAFAG